MAPKSSDGIIVSYHPDGTITIQCGQQSVRIPASAPSPADTADPLPPLDEGGLGPVYKLMTRPERHERTAAKLVWSRYAADAEIAVDEQSRAVHVHVRRRG